MSQLGLPFFELTREPAPPLAVPARDADSLEWEKSQDESISSEEKSVEANLAERAISPALTVPAMRRRTSPASSPRAAAPHGAWPAGLTFDDALAYTSLSASQLRRWHRAGALTFRRIGRNGAKVVLRAELDRLLEQLFAPGKVDIGEDFDFG